MDLEQQNIKISQQNQPKYEYNVNEFIKQQEEQKYKFKSVINNLDMKIVSLNVLINENQLKIIHNNRILHQKHEYLEKTKFEQHVPVIHQEIQDFQKIVNQILLENQNYLTKYIDTTIFHETTKKTTNPNQQLDQERMNRQNADIISKQLLKLLLHQIDGLNKQLQEQKHQQSTIEAKLIYYKQQLQKNENTLRLYNKKQIFQLQMFLIEEQNRLLLEKLTQFQQQAQKVNYVCNQIQTYSSVDISFIQQILKDINNNNFWI